MPQNNDQNDMFRSQSERVNNEHLNEQAQRIKMCVRAYAWTEKSTAYSQRQVVCLQRNAAAHAQVLFGGFAFAVIVFRAAACVHAGQELVRATRRARATNQGESVGAGAARQFNGSGAPAGSSAMRAARVARAGVW